ncbi:MAG: hypothetical protein D6679_02125 [Candidatus Hydrogenedentota bacterium]|nr:MAG: hypothetical protein D6679_02125 [Candidatus Hydrogenedentota bacterium]
MTYCSARKKNDQAPLPARERYVSPRIQRIEQKAKASGADFRILSGKFGLLAPDEKIPYYDKKLSEEDLSRMIEESEKRLCDYQHITFWVHPGDDVELYQRVIEEAARRNRAAFEVLYI